MAEIITGEHSRYRNNLIDMHRTLQVVLWDTGPEKPKPPARPVPPKGIAGDPEFDLGRLEFAEALEAYEAGLKKFKRDKDEFEHWQTTNGGPVELTRWSCDARDAIQHDTRAVAEGRQHKRRYYISSRTRGYQHLENRGLPIGVEPGRGQDKNLERQADDDRALAIARQQDPVFGEGAA